VTKNNEALWATCQVVEKLRRTWAQLPRHLKLVALLRIEKDLFALAEGMNRTSPTVFADANLVLGRLHQELIGNN
jgi:hypothetical protein